MKKLFITFAITFGAFTICSAENAPIGGDITISPGQNRGSSEQTIIEEFQERGIRYIKVTPKKGPPYYLIDSDGDGDMDTRRNNLTPNMLVPSWTIFTW